VFGQKVSFVFLPIQRSSAHKDFEAPAMAAECNNQEENSMMEDLSRNVLTQVLAHMNVVDRVKLGAKNKVL